MCPIQNYKSNVDIELEESQRLVVDVSTSSHENQNFTVNVDFLHDFLITKLNQPKSFNVTPAQPLFFQFSFEESPNVDMIIVKASSEDDFCAMLAIQNTSCPVYDLEDNIQYADIYQTMTLQAAITVPRSRYPAGFYITLVTLSNDETCSSYFQHITNYR